MQALSGEARRIKGRTKSGLIAGSLMLQGEAQKLTPVDTGNLRGSAFPSIQEMSGAVEETKNRVSITIGFNAEYAAAVHENLEIRFRNGTAKFLSKAVENNRERFFEIVRGYVNDDRSG